ncbi:hypothetical protein AB3S75_013790 [Citrus x aurantiifolia]
MKFNLLRSFPLHTTEVLQEKGIRMRDGDIDGDYLDRQL